MIQTIPHIGVVTSANSANAADARLRAAGFTDDQIARARSLIAAKRIAKVPGLAATFVATASDDLGRYMVDRYACQCAVGRKRKPCYHRAAVLLVEADAKSTAERYASATHRHPRHPSP